MNTAESDDKNTGFFSNPIKILPTRIARYKINKTVILSAICLVGAVIISLGLFVTSQSPEIRTWAAVQASQKPTTPATRVPNRQSDIDGLPALNGEKAIRHLKKNGMYSSLGEAVTASRYKAEKINEKVVASNPANKFHAEFDREGVRLSSTSQDSNWLSRWRLESVGYGDHQTPIKSGELSSNGQRVEIKREKQNLVEWFENRPKGLEHGFALSSRPQTKQTPTGSLRLVMKVSGDLKAEANKNGQGLTLTDGKGKEVIRYKKLKVWDADKTEQTARMQVSDDKVILEVEEAKAKYPLTIDPTFETVKLLAPDGVAHDWFGNRVAIFGDTAFVGAERDDVGSNTNQGSVHVFVRSGTAWTHHQQLTASDGAVHDQLGQSISISGDTAVIGASNGHGNVSFSGAAYIFVKNAGGFWNEQAKLTASDGTYNDLFGWSVSISGNTVIVGAYWEDVGSSWNQGAAYIFVRSGTIWTEQQKLIASDNPNSPFFGKSVAISGDTAIVGAEIDDIGGNIDQGSAYIFVRSGTTWTEQQKLTASDGAVSDHFGLSVAISGNTAIIGSDSDDISSNQNQGSAYVFVRSGTTWTNQQKLTSSDGGALDNFGKSVAISGNTAIVGANVNEGVSGVLSGSAYIFVRGGAIWTQQTKLLASDGGHLEHFGESVSISGDQAIVGAPRDNDNGNLSGSAYIFSIVPPNLPPQANAGPDQAIRAGDTVDLDGSTSFDDNTASGDLVYAWSFTSKPLGSTATLTDADTVTPSFVADLNGDYVVSLEVTDEGALSDSDEVEISSSNLAPTADAGDDQLVTVGNPVNLDGSESSDPEEDALTYSWSIISAPGSIPVLSAANTAMPSFSPDLEGFYTLRLDVSDFIGPGTPDTVEITATAPEGSAEDKIRTAFNIVKALGPGQVTTKGNQKAMLNFLSQAIKALQNGDPAKAIHKLELAIARTDGCVLRISPDGNGPGRDWITDCTVQTEVYTLLSDALAAITP